MAENSKIEWTDHTFNGWIGCTKVSPGCAHCYAETQDNFRKWTPDGWGAGKPRKRTSVANWKTPIAWDKSAALRATLCAMAEPPERFERPRVFCASLSDWLDPEVPPEWLADLLDIIRRTPNLDWQLLTKRPELWRSRMQAVVDHLGNGFYCPAGGWLAGDAPPNVWIGTTVEDQKRADERIPALLKIPARVRFLSCEPLLGPIEFSDVTHRSDCVKQLGKPALSGIDWVICGGESGPGARPMHPDWARSLRDQCAAVGVPFLFKQWGEWHEGFPTDSNVETRVISPGVIVGRFGKKAAGRILDGIEHNGFPNA